MSPSLVGIVTFACASGGVLPDMRPRGVLRFWLTVTFASFGLFAPRNGTGVALLLVCAASIAGTMFLALEMDGPFGGLLRTSPDPLRCAYERPGQ